MACRLKAASSVGDVIAGRRDGDNSKGGNAGMSIPDEVMSAILGLPSVTAD